MRKICLLLGLLVCFSGLSQNPDYHRFGARSKYYQPDTLSTALRDALTPKLGTILYHKDTGISQWEQWDGTDWVEFGAGAEYTFSDTAEIDLTLTGDDVTADLVSGSIDETKLDASVNASLDLADTSVQPGDISGFVTLTTNQTITGAKIFDTGTNVTNISSEYTGTGFGLGSLNSGTGTGIFSFNLSDGTGIVSNGASISTGNVYEGQNDGTTTFYVNKEGDVGANSFITTGGTSDDFVKGDGSLDSGSYQSTITGAASTIVTSDLTNNRALISNGSGKVAVSAVTTTELSYVSGVTSALQTQLNSKLNSSSYTAADVLAKLLTVDGSGSGLDADLLRGVHWGNVNTNIVTTGTIRGANNLGINGTGTGTSNTVFSAFYESNGTTRQGYVGFPSGSNSDLYLRNDVTNKDLRLRDTGILTYNGAGEFTGTVSVADPVNPDDAVNLGYAQSNFATVESGTWTPTIAGCTLTVSYAKYRKIGDQVTVYCRLNSISGTTTGILAVSGLPFSLDSGGTGGVSISVFSGFGSNFYSVYGDIGGTGGVHIEFLKQDSLDSGNNTVFGIGLTPTSAFIELTATYITSD